MAGTRGRRGAPVLALLLVLGGASSAGAALDAQAPAPDTRGSTEFAAGWAHVGTGPLATSTGLRASVKLPAGVVAGDLLLLSCQGKRNTMDWSAPGFGSIAWDYDLAPIGPAGLRLLVLWRWATAGESGAVTVTNTTGVNGWSCAMTAMRGGAGSGWTVYTVAGGSGGAQRDMVAADLVDDRAGYLMTHWFASSDDNQHGRPSHGSLAFGGSGYDTTLGTDHAASMSWEVGSTEPCWPPEECPPPDPPYRSLTMRQLANAADAYAWWTVVFSPTELTTD